MKRLLRHLVAFVYWAGVFWAIGIMFMSILAAPLGLGLDPTDYFFTVAFAAAGFGLGWVVRYVSLGEPRLFP